MGTRDSNKINLTSKRLLLFIATESVEAYTRAEHYMAMLEILYGKEE